MNEKLLFRELKKIDWKQVSRIYQKGLHTGNATFESNILGWHTSAKFSRCAIL